MIIYRTAKLGLITQKFGRKNTGSLLKDYEAMGLLGHNGIDWQCYENEPMYYDVSDDGFVTQVDNKDKDKSAGCGIVIVSQDKDGNYFKHIYWHFVENSIPKRLLKIGAIVKTGDLIGLGDSTGFSTGHHLHRGLKKCNNKGATLDYNNGYKGAIDPEPYYNIKIYVFDLIRWQKQVSIIATQLDILKVLFNYFFKKK